MAAAHLAAFARSPPRAPAAVLDERLLEHLLMDTTSRVRAVAQRRARERGVDAAAVYRAWIDGGSFGARAAALEGLCSVGGQHDGARFFATLRSDTPRARAVAAAWVARHADPDVARSVLVPVLLDPEPSVTSATA